MSKIIMIGQSAANPRIGASSTTSPEMGVGRSRPKRSTPKSPIYGDMVNNMVYTIMRVIENEIIGIYYLPIISTIRSSDPL